MSELNKIQNFVYIYDFKLAVTILNNLLEPLKGKKDKVRTFYSWPLANIWISFDRFSQKKPNIQIPTHKSQQSLLLIQKNVFKYFTGPQC